MRPVNTLLSASVFLSSTVHALSFDCNHIRAEGKSFNLKKLGGEHSVYSSDDSLGTIIRNTTWTLNICEPLKKVSGVPPEKQCTQGTNVCGIREWWNPKTDPDHETPSLIEAISVAGSLTDTGSALDPYFTPLNKTDDHPGGLRAELKGGKYGSNKQQAIIEFLCDHERSGNERRDSDGDNVSRRDEEDKPTSIIFKSYKKVEDEKLDILRLEWKTKYVCEDYEEDDDEDGSKKSSWGFFTWFIVILFMGAAAYLIFGSWLNYNRYGARGWDLLPHGDTIRDVPYIFKDFSRKVLDTFSGGGSRGGYSAV